jgi:hypothetical protein
MPANPSMCSPTFSWASRRDEKNEGKDDKADNGKKKRSKFDMKQNQDINHEEK